MGVAGTVVGREATQAPAVKPVAVQAAVAAPVIDEIEEAELAAAKIALEVIGPELVQDVPAPAIVQPTVAAEPKARTIEMEVTAYCACKKCCGPKAQGITASGKHVSHNNGLFVAADKQFKFGTKLLIPGYAAGKPVEVLDRGGAIKGNKLDVYFASHQEALKWGRQKLTVTVVE